jgi:hypothetical protein
MTFSGTTADVNAVLDGMVYAPPASYAGAATLSTDVTGTQTASSTVPIAINGSSAFCVGDMWWRGQGFSLASPIRGGALSGEIPQRKAEP